MRTCTSRQQNFTILLKITKNSDNLFKLCELKVLMDLKFINYFYLIKIVSCKLKKYCSHNCWLQTEFGVFAMKKKKKNLSKITTVFNFLNFIFIYIYIDC